MINDFLYVLKVLIFNYNNINYFLKNMVFDMYGRKYMQFLYSFYKNIYFIVGFLC